MDERETGYIDPKMLGGSYIPDESEEQQTDFRNYFLAILRRRWMILSVTALVVLAVAIYSFLQTPTYQSKAVLDIDAPGAYLFVADPVAQPIYWKSRESFMNTQFRILKSKSMARRVAEKLNLTLDDFTKGVPKTSQKSVANTPQKENELNAVSEALLKKISVNPVQDTNLCEISFITPNPQLSMTLANTWAHEYVEQSFDSMEEYTRKASELLTDHVSLLQNEIAQKERMLHDYSLEKQIVKPDKTHSMSNEALATFNNALTSATKDRISAEVRYQALKSTGMEAIPDIALDPRVQQVRNQYIELERNYREQAKTYKPDYPEMIRLRQELDQIGKNLTTVRSEAYQSLLAAARSNYQEAVRNEAALERQLEESKRETVEAGKKELNYDQLQMEIENKKQLLTLLLQKQNETDVSAQAQQKKVTTTRIIEPAELPLGVFQPNIKNNLLLSLLAGLFAGMALAVALEFFDRSLKTPEDVERYLHLPFLGLVPQYAILENNRSNGSKTSRAVAKRHASDNLPAKLKSELLSVHDPLSSASEAIKMVRTSLLLAFPQAPPRSILITSTRAGEGKTFVACNLAIALTQLDKRVVLIDADMRNPRIHRIWDVHNGTGLSIYLTSDVPITSVLRPSSVSRLSLISSGPKTPRPAELLASGRFEAMIRQLESEFDFVVLDSPPILPVADSVILASRAKGVVMVIHGGTTPRDVVWMAKKKLAASNPVIVGTVVNGIDFTDPYYHYRYYSNYSYPYYGKDSA